MDKWAKPELIDSWDNTGFQVGDEKTLVSKILIALDLDRTILNKAINEDYQMIITHHPIIFKPINKITADNYKENILLDLIKHNIVAYNAHSNLDLAHNGVSHILADKLGIMNTKPLNIVYNDEVNIHGYGRVGELKDISKNDLVQLIKERLDTEYLIVYGVMPETIKTIAVCGGSGSDFILDAHSQGAEVYLTGDIKYHDAQLAIELGLVLMDAGHYNTEKTVLPVIKEYLSNELNGSVEIHLVYESTIPCEIL